MQQQRCLHDHRRRVFVRMLTRLGRRCVRRGYRECSSHPCQRRHVLGLKLGPKYDVNAFRCACKDNWMGVVCSTQDDVCASSPCQNGGTCVDDSDGDGTAIFSCTCARGFGGDLCSATSVCNGASPTECQNGGSCVDDATNDEGYTCDCGSSGFNGARCETNTDDCDGDKNDCTNGINDDGSLKAEGTCVDAINAVTCTCHAGFSGDTCEEAVPICGGDTNPCQNGGTCTDDTTVESGFTCACADGYVATLARILKISAALTHVRTTLCVAIVMTATLVRAWLAHQLPVRHVTCAETAKSRMTTRATAGTGREMAPAARVISVKKAPDDTKTHCQDCPAGTATAAPGTGRCDTCEPGHEPMAGPGADPATGSTGCVECAGEQFSADRLSCNACDPANTHTPITAVAMTALTTVLAERAVQAVQTRKTT